MQETAIFLFKCNELDLRKNRKSDEKNPNNSKKVKSAQKRLGFHRFSAAC
jgi:hypothetical protein